MALNFDEIITRANARKEALQEVQRLLRGWSQFEENYRQAATYADELLRVFQTLDTESRDILTGKTLGASHDYMSALCRALDGPASAWRTRTLNQTWGMAEVVVKRATE